MLKATHDDLVGQTAATSILHKEQQELAHNYIRDSLANDQSIRSDLTAKYILNKRSRLSKWWAARFYVVKLSRAKIDDQAVSLWQTDFGKSIRRSPNDIFSGVV